MKCRRHPDTELLKGKRQCFLCEDWIGAQSPMESDRLKFERQMWVSHIDPSLNPDAYSTRGKYQKLLKSRGLTDDVSLKELRDRTVDRAYRERVRERKIHAFTEQLREPALRRSEQPVQCRTDTQRYLWNRLRQLVRR